MIKEMVNEFGLLLVVPVVILLIQSTWLFLDARKRGRKAWFWGLWGLIQCPGPTLVYLLVLYIQKRKNKR